MTPCPHRHSRVISVQVLSSSRHMPLSFSAAHQVRLQPHLSAPLKLEELSLETRARLRVGGGRSWSRGFPNGYPHTSVRAWCRFSR